MAIESGFDNFYGRYRAIEGTGSVENRTMESRKINKTNSLRGSVCHVSPQRPRSVSLSHPISAEHLRHKRSFGAVGEMIRLDTASERREKRRDHPFAFACWLVHLGLVWSIGFLLIYSIFVVTFSKFFDESFGPEPILSKHHHRYRPSTRNEISAEDLKNIFIDFTLANSTSDHSVVSNDENLLTELIAPSEDHRTESKSTVSSDWTSSGTEHPFKAENKNRTRNENGDRAEYGGGNGVSIEDGKGGHQELGQPSVGKDNSKSEL